MAYKKFAFDFTLFDQNKPDDYLFFYNGNLENSHLEHLKSP